MEVNWLAQGSSKKTNKNLVKSLIAIVCIALCFLFKNFINIPGLSTDAVYMIGIFISSIILWLFVDIGWTISIIFIALFLLPQAGVTNTITASFGNSTITFLIFSMILTYGVSSTGLMRRIAVKFITSKFASKGYGYFLLMFLLAEFLIGLFVAPTTLFVLFNALVIEICGICGFEKENRFAKVLMVGTGLIASISCATTPIAHTFPLMAMGFYEAEFGIAINYWEYMKIGIPVGLLLFAITFFVIVVLNKKAFNNQIIVFEKLKDAIKLPTISIKEVIAGMTLFLVIVLWIVSGIINVPILKTLNTTGIALIGIAILCLVNIGDKPIMDFNTSVKNGVSWPSIMLCSTTLAVGKFLTSGDLGITQFIGSKLSVLFSDVSVVTFLFFIIVCTIVLTNLMSNIVTTTVMYSMIMPIVLSINTFNGYESLVTILIGMCASLAFATPSSIAHIALAGSSQWTEPKDMLKNGGLVMIISIIVVFFMTLGFGGI